MKRKISSLLLDGCRCLIEIDCASPAWGVWVRCSTSDHVGRLIIMMRIIRELNDGEDPLINPVHPDVTPAMCEWWIDAKEYIEKL